MKHLCFGFILLFLIPSVLKAQESFEPFSKDSAFVLLADNGKQNRLYANMRTLKIHYLFDGQIIKAKGRLLIRNEKAVQLMPFRAKDIVIIPIDSVISITPWHRKDKINTTIAAGTGVATLGIAGLIHRPPGPGLSYQGLIQIGLLIYSISMFWTVVIMLPIDTLGEWMFIRSKKKGYNFSIEKIAFKQDRWGKEYFPNKLPKDNVEKE